uniref:AIG1-type G domain-containing protein n=1 Tax=Naja naja TaxID=35670 RepID=A0A8C6V8C7_NAJNA
PEGQLGGYNGHMLLTRPFFLSSPLWVAGPERRIVLVGRSRNGISATGNTILGSKVFEFEGPGFGAVTQACQKEEAQLKDRKVVVVDTPGFFHSSRPQEDIVAEVSKCVNFYSPGPQVILHVMHPSCFFEDEIFVAQQIKEIFGLKAKDYTILLFTHKEYLEVESLEYIVSFDENLKGLNAECGNRYLAFDNNAEGAKQEAQVAELMTMIDDLVRKNRYAPCYTEDMMNELPNQGVNLAQSAIETGGGEPETLNKELKYLIVNVLTAARIYLLKIGEMIRHLRRRK